MEELQQALEDAIGGAENLESCDSEKESVTDKESKLSQSGAVYWETMKQTKQNRSEILMSKRPLQLIEAL